MMLTSLLTDFINWWGDFFSYDPANTMMFNTGLFLGTFLVFLLAYIPLSSRKTLRVIYVTVFSLFFYYKASGWFFLLLILSTLIDYAFGLLIYAHHEEETPYHRHRWLGREWNMVDLRDWFSGMPIEARHGSTEHRAAWLLGAIGQQFVPLFALFLTAIDRLISRFVPEENRSRRRRVLLTMSVVANLGLLAYFKYTNFLIGTLGDLFSLELEPMDIFLPVGISFFTFQTMSYTIDIYRGKLEPVRSIMDFAFYVSFFPQLVAGPIVRAADFIPQIRANLKISQADIGRALLLIGTGAFKKLVISDYLSVNFVDRVFEAPGLYSGVENLLAVYGYTLQIYCDFSGYTDIAIGIALLMGFRLPVNFRAPYQAHSVQDFWRRWHISLSTWLRDYLYISLGGNRRGQWRTYFNLLMTMFLGGLWHGAAWTFIFWGALHGVALALHRMLRDTRFWIRRQVSWLLDRLDERQLKAAKNDQRDEFAARITEWRWRMQGWFPLVLTLANRVLGMVLTFHFVCFTWIFFRAQSFASAWEMIRQITSAQGLSEIWSMIGASLVNLFSSLWYLITFRYDKAGEAFGDYDVVILLMILGYLLHLIPDDVEVKLEKRFVLSPIWAKSLVMAGVIWLVLQTQSAGPQSFIYFQF